MEQEFITKLKIRIFNHLKTVPGIVSLACINDSEISCDHENDIDNCINIIVAEDGYILKLGVKILIAVPAQTILHSIYEDINWLFNKQKLTLKDIDIIIQGVQ